MLFEKICYVATNLLGTATYFSPIRVKYVKSSNRNFVTSGKVHYMPSFSSLSFTWQSVKNKSVRLHFIDLWKVNFKNMATTYTVISGYTLNILYIPRSVYIVRTKTEKTKVVAAVWGLQNLFNSLRSQLFFTRPI